jgi:cytosolic phospholipase A2
MSHRTGLLGKFVLGAVPLALLLTTAPALRQPQFSLWPAPSSLPSNSPPSPGPGAPQPPEQDEASTLARLKLHFSSLPDKFTPESVGLPPRSLEWLDKLKSELVFSPNSLAQEILSESLSPALNPEVVLDARVRLGNELSPEETAFLERRAEITRRALARYLGVPEHEVDVRDVPVIAVAGSGGGYRAMIATTGTLLAFNQSGLFDCLTYLAGFLPFVPSN